MMVSVMTTVSPITTPSSRAWTATTKYLPNPGNGENVLDDEGARDDQAEHRAGGRDYWNERVADDMWEDEPPSRQTLRSRRANVLLCQGLEHRSARRPDRTPGRSQSLLDGRGPGGGGPDPAALLVLTRVVVLGKGRPQIDR